MGSEHVLLPYSSSNHFHADIVNISLLFIMNFINFNLTFFSLEPKNL